MAEAEKANGSKVHNRGVRRNRQRQEYDGILDRIGRGPKDGLRERRRQAYKKLDWMLLFV
ncbi:hypothetical protein PT974_10776 [Cladobotryum mycophilum]|uniref:Uncharacterized protein n=1 Tax=Cladobotryum mycophilum TaxID=491253 RepID=A0ABR0SBQ3_9HYPO